MDRAFRRWADRLQPALPQNKLGSLQKAFARSYTIYGVMLLLPPSPFESQDWKVITAIYGERGESDLFASISKELKVTHIAVNHPIPLRQDGPTVSQNTIRAPLKFTPVFGDFGPPACTSPPSREDFDGAYWVTAKQNGIAQTWAPRWTMFSRGNISEKARILTLPSVAKAVEEGRLDGAGCAAVDLYAGIGYFAFSYARAGCSKVLCWDLNEWSCEGLRRGVKANKWSCATYEARTALDALAKGEDHFLIFNEPNDCVIDRIQATRKHLPPIRHVNCGLLPTSRGSWSTAVAALDPDRGGWVHVHENFAEGEIESKAEEVRDVFQGLLHDTKEKVVLDGIIRVKTYAPGVYHCVLDIWIPPHPGDGARESRDGC